MSKGNVITFYSYKGGVGRTFALANIAALLSTWGYKVLCIDWDLEAPGLQFYFQSRMVAQNPPGLLEFIRDYVSGSHPSWRNYTTAVSFGRAGVPLLFMQAGRQDELYVQRLQNLDWGNLYAEHNLGNFLEQVRNEWKEALDFVFIDSRTGITDIGGICTIQLPDFLVVLLTANEQSLAGSIDTINRLRATQAELPLDHGNIPVLPIISRFEGRLEYRQAERWLAKFAQRLAPFYKEWLHRDIKIEEILNFTRIPSIPFWSFGEELPVIEKGTDDPDDIGFSLETLAALIAQELTSTDVLIRNREVFVSVVKNEAQLLPDETMQPIQLGQQFAKSAPLNVYISYAYQDKRYKEELERHLAILRRQKAITFWSDGQLQAGSDRRQEINARLAESQLILLLISADYLASPASDQEMLQALTRAETGDAVVIPIILRSVSLQGHPISMVRSLPSNAISVSSWADRDAAWADIVSDIYAVVQHLRTP